MRHFAQMNLHEEEQMHCLALDCGPGDVEPGVSSSEAWMLQSGGFLLLTGLMALFLLKRRGGKFWMLSIMPLLAAIALLVMYYVAEIG